MCFEILETFRGEAASIVALGIIKERQLRCARRLAIIRFPSVASQPLIPARQIEAPVTFRADVYYTLRSALPQAKSCRAALPPITFTRKHLKLVIC